MRAVHKLRKSVSSGSSSTKDSKDAERLQGGVLIFDKRGNLKAIFQEEYGEEKLDMKAIRDAVANANAKRESAKTRATRSASISSYGGSTVRSVEEPISTSSLGMQSDDDVDSQDHSIRTANAECISD